MESRSKSTVKELNKYLPLRRFVVGPRDPDPSNQLPISEHKSGDISIVEGLPHHAKFTVSLQQLADRLTSYDIAMIVQSLPFKDQCTLFWNLLGYNYSSGVSVSLAYRGNALGHFRGRYDESNNQDPNTTLNAKVVYSISNHH